MTFISTVYGAVVMFKIQTRRYPVPYHIRSDIALTLIRTSLELTHQLHIHSIIRLCVQNRTKTLISCFKSTVEKHYW